MGGGFGDWGGGGGKVLLLELNEGGIFYQNSPCKGGGRGRGRGQGFGKEVHVLYILFLKTASG